MPKAARSPASALTVKKNDNTQKVARCDDAFVSDTTSGKMDEAKTVVQALLADGGLPPATDNQMMVWSACLLVPKGHVASYGSISRVIQKARGEDYSHPRYSRMVGKLLSQNPVAPYVPCHRVVGCSGRLVGFQGSECAISKKYDLLKREGVQFKDPSAPTEKATVKDVL
jgi:O-6-methylguanine DNA methyltransferase